MRPRLSEQRRRARGFSLIEVTLATAVVGVLAAAAVPSHLASLQRARRIDAMAALQRMQAAQEQYRSHHGRYGDQLAALVGVGSLSAEGHYTLVVKAADGGRVTLAAQARGDGAQRGDTDCREITLRLDHGLAEQGPSGRCWNQ